MSLLVNFKHHHLMVHCQAFGSESARWYPMIVDVEEAEYCDTFDPDDVRSCDEVVWQSGRDARVNEYSVLVFDDVAGHYTANHRLSHQVMEEIIDLWKEFVSGDEPEQSEDDRQARLCRKMERVHQRWIERLPIATRAKLISITTQELQQAVTRGEIGPQAIVDLLSGVVE